MADSEVVYPLGDDVHWLMARLARGLGMVEAEAVEPHGISLREFVVLAEVDAEPGRSQLAVARAAAVDRSLMVTVVDSLQQKGFVKRSQHPTDRRVRTLDITPEGGEVLAKAADAVRVAEERLLSTLSATRRKELRAALVELASGAADGGFDVAPC
jgi:DNA-binding MarR family transcriptional regulator